MCEEEERLESEGREKMENMRNGKNDGKKGKKGGRESTPRTLEVWNCF